MSLYPVFCVPPWGAAYTEFHTWGFVRVHFSFLFGGSPPRILQFRIGGLSGCGPRLWSWSCPWQSPVRASGILLSSLLVCYFLGGSQIVLAECSENGQYSYAGDSELRTKPSVLVFSNNWKLGLLQTASLRGQQLVQWAECTVGLR